MRFLRTFSAAIVACLVLTASSHAQSATTNTNTVLIMYDGSGQYGWIGGMYGRMLANLLGHFDLPYQIAPVENYQAGQMDAYRSTFYFGSVYDNPLPATFKADVLTTTNSLAWFRYNLWQVADSNFIAQTGFQFNFLDWSGYSNIVYKGESFVKNQLDPELGYITVVNSNLATVIATANKSDGTSIPYATRSGHFWYFADTPFEYISEEDRYLIFCDLLHDILGIDHPVSHSAVIRIEDVGPTVYPTSDLRAVADLLKTENVPFAVALVPVYRDPLGEYSGGVPTEHRLSDTSDPASVDFVTAIRYMITNGAQLLIHGYTHQYNNVINPYTGVTGDDFEFWRETFSDPNTLAIDIYAPVPEDSANWALGRMNAAKAELAAAGMQAVGWEYPHYAASELDTRISATNFPLAMHRVLYFDDAGHVAGQFFPYVINRDIYGQKIIPENIGNIEPVQWFNYPIRLPADLIRAARKNLVIRDGWANGYFHPFFNRSYLRDTVRGIKALGYTYVPLPEPPLVGVAPAITSQPQSLTRAIGSTASFSVTATGTAPLSYQWRFKNTNISGATNATYSIASVQLANGGNYDVVVTNNYGAVTSAVAALTLGSPPAITSQPQSATNTVGTSASFTVSASGTTPLRYKWQFNSVNIANATNATLTLNNVQAANAGNYRAIVTNSFGSATSAVATLTIVSAPAITAQPQSQSALLGGNATFSVTATGTAPLAYQWRFNGANIAGTTGSSFTVVNMQSNSVGGYTVVVTNNYGSVTSAAATLSLASIPSITSQPLSRTNLTSTSASFSVAATGTAPLRYQWRFNGANLANQTNATLTINNVQPANGGSYTVVVSNNFGSATSAAAVLTVVSAPAITSQPQSRTNLVGSSVTFSVTASGTAPLAYQWRFNGANIVGATNSSLTLANLQTSNTGGYSVVVSNPYGAATSVTANLLVGSAPAITMQPVSQSVRRNSSVTFSVVAAGTAPLAYQWYQDGSAISGATSSSYNISSVRRNDGGTYNVIVRNSFGSATSANATLTVR